jgi:hypothetical protein
MELETEGNSFVPERIIKKLEQIKQEAEIIAFEATLIHTTKLKQIQFYFHQKAEKPLFSDFERAQSVCFVTKYDSLPTLEGIIVEEEAGKYYFKNLDFFRHMLNKFRPIIQNQKDSIYFQNIHKFIREKLTNTDPSINLVLDVLDEKGLNITTEFIKALDERIKSIRLIINKCDYKYIYNGILQHSDHNHTNRFWEDYYSGEINYIFLKHAILLNSIKKMLFWHYRIINFNTFPSLGSL